MSTPGPERSRAHSWRSVASLAATSLLTVVVLVVLAPRLSFIEVRVLDLLYRMIPAGSADPRIVLVDVGDDPSAYEQWRAEGDAPPAGCEIPRRAYAEAVRRLSRWGAKAVVFDLMFMRPCQYEDAELAQAFQQARNVIVAASTKAKPGAVGLAPPVPPLDQAVWGVGSPAAHQPNETVRSVPLVVRDRDSGDEYLALSLLAFQRFMDLEPAQMQLSDGRWLLAADRRVPLISGESIRLLPLGGSEGRPDTAVAAVEVVRGGNVEEVPQLTTWNAMLINWVGPKGTIAPLLLSDVLAMDEISGPEQFEGKAVIIGRMDWDEHWTAVGAMPGPEVQANALNTLLSGAFVRAMYPSVSPWVFLAVLAAFAAVTTLAVRRLRGFRATLSVIGLIVVAVVLSRQLLVARGLWLYPFYCGASVLLAWGFTTASKSEKVTSMLSRFVPSFIGQPGARGLGEVRTLDATMLFSDIRRYTGISEQLAAEQMLALLSSYRSAVEDIIAKHGGIIIKTPGDAILAVFWQEIGGVNHAASAVEAGREILENMPALAEAWESAGVGFEIGIGINAGSVAMGLVGKRQLEPTVIGDAVNVAQRLETLTKDLGYPLIFSESVREQLHQDVGATPLDEVTVRGRTLPVKIYGVAGPDGPSRPPEQDANDGTNGEDNGS